MTAANPYWSGPNEWEPEDVSLLQRVTQDLVAPPHLPEHNQDYIGVPRVVQVRMVIEEKEIEVAPGAFVWAFTFNGSVPGPIIVVHGRRLRGAHPGQPGTPTRCFTTSTSTPP